MMPAAFATPIEAITAVHALDGRVFVIDGGPIEMSLAGDPRAYGLSGDAKVADAIWSTCDRWLMSMRSADFAAAVRAIVIAHGKDMGGGTHNLTKGMA